MGNLLTVVLALLNVVFLLGRVLLIRGVVNRRTDKSWIKTTKLGGHGQELNQGFRSCNVPSKAQQFFCLRLALPVWVFANFTLD